MPFDVGTRVVEKGEGGAGGSIKVGEEGIRQIGFKEPKVFPGIQGANVGFGKRIGPTLRKEDELPFAGGHEGPHPVGKCHLEHSGHMSLGSVMEGNLRRDFRDIRGPSVPLIPFHKPSRQHPRVVGEGDDGVGVGAGIESGSPGKEAMEIGEGFLSAEDQGVAAKAVDADHHHVVHSLRPGEGGGQEEEEGGEHRAGNGGGVDRDRPTP